MIIQTIQPDSVLQEVQEKGIVFSKPQLSIYGDCPDQTWGFFQAYEWMKKQMIAKNIKPEYGEKDIFWGWVYANNFGKRKVDLRYHRHQYRGKGHVLLTLEKKDTDVLKSDYEFWHYVLNYWALVKSKKEEKYWDLQCENTEYNFFKNKPLANDLHKDIEASWHNIFSLKPCEDGFTYDLTHNELKYLGVKNEKLTIQGTFWNIKKDDVLSVQYIK